VRLLRITIVAATVLAVAACGGSSGPPGRPPVTTPPTAGQAPTLLPAPTPSSTPARPADRPADLDAVPSRVVLPALGIDLPVVSGDETVPGNPRDYPLCDVAQYLTTYRYPARPGTTTWVYAHAREGMFLPLLEASEREDGAELIGQEVTLYSTGLRRSTWAITEVHRHATDRSAGARVPPDERRLVLQTSEGPRGTVPKLQVVARLTTEEGATAADAAPSAAPRGCFTP
jgi:hypothetical protein